MMRTMTEKATLFGDDGTLTGIVTLPADTVAPRSTAFVFLNAGVVHRVGPNRMYVTAARRLAALGFRSVRVDLSGLGDSPSRRDNLPFDQASVLEVGQVLTAMQRDYAVAGFITGGLCSGAAVAFRAAVTDERVRGAVLLNPQGFVDSPELAEHVETRTLARSYWRQRLLSGRSWKQALTGRTDYRRLVAVLGSRARSLLVRDRAVTTVAGRVAEDFARLHERDVRLLIACSEADSGVDYLTTILGRRFRRRKDIQTLTLPRGDHSLTMPASQQQFFDGLTRWARALPAPESRHASHAAEGHRAAPPAPAGAAQSVARVRL
jgi:pimeloyl-ACP methyl ester carboxylesterase